jgi:hypothetical protein
MIEGDSKEYELLTKWAKNFDCQGYKSCEIGVRQGLGSAIILNSVRNNYIHVGVDPYANLEYQHYDTTKPAAYDYTDQMRDTLLNDFYRFRNQGQFTLANMTDIDFMNHPDHKNSKYAFVHFDGPHMTKDVVREALWFADRAAPHTRFVFDDYPTFDMPLITQMLNYFGFKIIDKGEHKICLSNKDENI